MQGKSLLGFKKGRFPYRNVLRTSSLGLKYKQKHDLLLGVVYPFKAYIYLVEWKKNKKKPKIYLSKQIEVGYGKTPLIKGIDNP